MYRARRERGSWSCDLSAAVARHECRNDWVELTVTLNGSQATVIGVMPAGFTFPSPEVDAWVPLSLSAKNRSNREGAVAPSHWPAQREHQPARCGDRDGRYLAPPGSSVPGDQYGMERIAGAAAGGVGG